MSKLLDVHVFSHLRKDSAGDLGVASLSSSIAVVLSGSLPGSFPLFLLLLLLQLALVDKVSVLLSFLLESLPPLLPLCFLLFLGLLPSLLENSLLSFEVEGSFSAVVVEPLLDVSFGLLLVDVVLRGRNGLVEVFKESGDVGFALSVISLESASEFTAQPGALHRFESHAGFGQATVGASLGDSSSSCNKGCLFHIKSFCIISCIKSSLKSIKVTIYRN